MAAVAQAAQLRGSLLSHRLGPWDISGSAEVGTVQPAHQSLGLDVPAQHKARGADGLRVDQKGQQFPGAPTAVEPGAGLGAPGLDVAVHLHLNGIGQAVFVLHGTHLLPVFPIIP